METIKYWIACALFAVGITIFIYSLLFIPEYALMMGIGAFTFALFMYVYTTVSGYEVRHWDDFLEDKE